MKQFIIVSLVFALLVCSLVAEKEYTESDRKFLCAFKCWKQQRADPKNKLADCLDSCKASKNAEASDAAEPEAEVTAESDQGAGLIDEQQLWNQFRTVMLNALTQGQDKPYIQLLTTPIAAQWDTSDPTQFKRVSNHVPYWGEYYSASPFKIDDQYCGFLKNIKTDDKVVDRDSKVLADQFESEIQQLGSQLTAERTKCTREFLALATKPDFKNFMNDCLAKSKLQDQIEEKKIMYQFFTSRAYGPEVADIFDARVDCETSTEWYEHSGSLSKFRADAKAGYARSLNVTIDSFTRISYPRTWSQIAGGMKRPSSLNSSFFQFAIQSGTGYLTATEKFNMQISFKGYGFVRSVPQKWFRHNVIKQFANGPFYNPQQNLFGANGTLRLKPTGFYLVYKPTMTVTVARSDVQKFFGANLKSAGGLFSSSREEVKIDTTNTAADTARISIISNSEDPLIVAIDNEPLP